MAKIKWLGEPEEHDYPAAESYLTLIFGQVEAERTVKKLRSALLSGFKAKDIFRASNLPLLGISNSHVVKNLRKIHDNECLSPLLLVTDKNSASLIIADGYHRLCSVYSVDEDALIPCRIVLRN